MVSFEVENVDETYQTLSEKGVDFINQPMDMPDWFMRVVHLRDPEENLIEFFTPLKAE
jgi:predicted enzyme related to lactoylglutathione lyase